MSPSLPRDPALTHCPVRRRVSLIDLLGGMRSICFWLMLMFGLSLAYDNGLFTDAPWQSASVFAAEVEGSEAAEEHHEEHEEHGHTNPVTPVLLGIVMILVLAKLGGDLFERFGMPAVLGELSVGILLGNFLFLTGSPVLEVLFHVPEFDPDNIPPNYSHDDVFYHPAAILKILSQIGVILLLFEVGLESTVREMMSVGVSSLLVAVLGVAAPLLLGWGVGAILLPNEPYYVHMFLGATLCATSVGITARVLKDLGRSKQRESQIILGAAVIDDVLGLVILTVVVGIISSQGAAASGGEFGATDVLIVIAKACGFLVTAVVLGAMMVTRPLFKASSYLRGHGMLVAVSLVICFGFAYLAALVGLEPIVGAFAAGLILERAQYRELNAKGEHELEEALAPLTALLVPIFFVYTGSQVDLASFSKPSVWLLASALTVMAILGKQVCSLGVVEKGLNKMAVGLGMIPRGEVGLIFAGVGAALFVTVEKNGELVREAVITPDTNSAIVVMVMITTMVTPPLLKWSLVRGDKPTAPTEQSS
ncbi:cation:proton antiporter [Thalassoroseus pseudoceratinae]|uniref:cation:proton antiporter n=1 Tax=Thalassoroseus pseudoceratinae TaxID=2713176 RepID=UPI001981BCED|nr:cation:proton antiporter [Thalassoroseus pseudoceratinae]